jgi:AraC-like DNA-binding protein
MIFEHHVGARIAGVAHRKFSRVLQDEGGVVAAKFTPGGFYPFAGVPVSRFTDATIPLGDVFGRDGDVLERTVLAGPADPSSIPIIEDFLRKRLPAPDAHAVRATEIVSAMAADRGVLRVEDLVARCQLNKRTLQRLFSKYVGVSPKWVIQRYRLHEAAERLASGDAVSQSALAADLGYSDQAHFVRDFKALVGTSPAAYGKQARRSEKERV